MDALKTLVVENGMFLKRESGAALLSADAALPQTGRIRDTLVSILDERPLTAFVLDVLALELRAHTYERDKSQNLVEMAPYQDSAVTADRLLDAFDSLPWTYAISIPLPPALSLLLGPSDTELKVSDKVRLVRATSDFQERFHSAADHMRKEGSRGERGVLGALFAQREPTWQENEVYVQVRCEGFIGPYGLTPTAVDAERLVRSFVGMGIATHLFEYDWSYTAEELKQHIFVHRLSDGGNWGFVTRYDLDDAATKCLRNLKIAASSGALASLADPRLRIVSGLKNIGRALDAGDSAEPTIRAAQWLFDSYAGTDELLAFVQAMIVLEILLGEKEPTEKVGIIELIANRFAYFVGTTHSERQRLITDLRKIYQVRSQIVHKGKHRLSYEERVLFSSLKWMCLRALDKEMQLLIAGQRPPL
ncbi:MAG: hypothetical protein AB7O88_20990 [Reyranellaceae bacterium]